MRLARACSLLVAALPVAAGLAYVHSYGVNLAWKDSWHLVPLFERLETGELTLTDLVSQHNEHRILFPRLVMLLLGRLTHYNSVAEMYVIQLLILASMIVTARTFLRQHPGRFGWWLAVPVAFLMFTPQQWSNMLFGFQIGLMMAQCAAVIALCAVDRVTRTGDRGARWRSFGLAVAAAAVSSFSGANGLLVWPVGLGQLLVSRAPERARFSVIWLLTAGANWGAYFWRYYKPDYHPPLSHVLDHPLSGAAYLLAWTGGSLASNETVAMVCGGILMLVTLIVVLLAVRHGRWAVNMVWLATLAWSFMTAGSAVIARGGFGTGQALDSKYAAFSVLIVIALYALLVDLVRARRRGARALLGVLLLLIVVTLPPAYRTARAAGRSQRNLRRNLVPVVLDYRSQPDQALSLVHGPDVVRAGAPILERLRYNAFAGRGQIPTQ